jgi:hypothetical protein
MQEAASDVLLKKSIRRSDHPSSLQLADEQTNNKRPRGLFTFRNQINVRLAGVLVLISETHLTAPCATDDPATCDRLLRSYDPCHDLFGEAYVRESSDRRSMFSCCSPAARTIGGSATLSVLGRHRRLRLERERRWSKGFEGRVRIAPRVCLLISRVSTSQYDAIYRR